MPSRSASVAVAALVVAAFVAGRAAAGGGPDDGQPPQSGSTSERDIPMMQISRPPPPRIAPVRLDGIRYEQVMNALSLGQDQLTGYLAAYDDRSGERLWVLKVYDVKHDLALEQDVQEVYFTRMEAVPGKARLLIENEARRRFVVDLADRSV